MRRSLPALALTALPLLATPASAGTPLPAEEQPFTSYARAQTPGGGPGAGQPLGLFEAIDRLPVAEEHREGYQRTLYKHWKRGLNATDGCDTRREVILSEAVNAPEIGASRKLTGGYWRSTYDNPVVTDAGQLDIDHFVPLAEVYARPRAGSTIAACGTRQERHPVGQRPCARPHGHVHRRRGSVHRPST
ncbi:hypothetical protein [Streptomyces sp. HB132]|uniref:hypothetical protein n=1 Tax=Streptomyces sp. HB132 TaxID=767388 RepID=UPI001960A175|nr:hypothetical protein [Streptomyces sp. HB132]MBM7443169.1 hypothetical protein [Streptomyces sp. HB132]